MGRLKRLSLGQWIGILFVLRIVVALAMRVLLEVYMALVPLSPALDEIVVALFRLPVQALQLLFLGLLVVWVWRGVRRLFGRRRPTTIPPAPPPSPPPA